MKTRKSRLTIAVLLSVVIAAGCAKQGMPTGGPKDVTPPQTKRYLPENRSLNFNNNSFFIEFDEYVVLKDAENNIIVSPPLKNKADYKTKGRGIQVKINDTLLQNTTYLFQFKDAIADYNEGNLLPSLEYVFSTGSYIDSMTLSGKAVDALTKVAREETICVWLYDSMRYERLTASLTDTSIGKVTPLYITRCDKNGKFRFNNIQPGNYHILAVADEDKNLTPGTNEAIAFTKTAVAAKPMHEQDSVAADSLKGKYILSKPLEMEVFSPKLDKQRITSSEFKSAGKVQITTLQPMAGPTIDGGDEEIVWRMNSSRDTLTLWTLREKCDSLRLVVSDSTGIQDTLKLRWRAKKGRPTTQATNNASHLEMKLNYKSLPYYDTLALLTATPLKSDECSLDSAVTIMLISDSSRIGSVMVMDSTAMKVMIVFPFKQGEKYSITVAKNCLHNIYGHSNDSLCATVTITKSEDYGTLRIKTVPAIGSIPNPIIVQLLDEKGVILSTQRLVLGGFGDVHFRNLVPGKYRVRAIVDSNNNGKWDTGDFTTGRQPEKVVFLPKTLDIRANWDFEETIEISD